MKPIKFEGCNLTYGEGQTEYRPLPGMRLGDDNGTVLFCWKLSLWQRVKVLFTGRVWQFMLTFDRPLTPQVFVVDSPLVREPKQSDNTGPS